MSLEKKLSNILDRYSNINKKLSSEKQPKDSNEIIKLNKEFSELLPIVEKINEYNKLKKETKDLENLIKSEKDQPIIQEAEKEIQIIEKKIRTIENEIFKLLLPKDIKPGEKRPVVVCQHGLEGVPMDTVTRDPKVRAFQYYSGFSAELADRGFIVFAPHNPYRGRNLFWTSPATDLAATTKKLRQLAWQRR